MDRLGNRTRQLEADNRRLTESNHLKDVFLSTASHELKTPLTSVIAYAELLDDREHRLDEGQRGEFLVRLRSEAQRLLGLIEDILDLSRIESGKLTLRRTTVSLESVVRSAVETTMATAEKYHVTLTERYAADMPAMSVDEVKLRQAVVNLIVNAVKFSPENETVSVSLHQDGPFAVIDVSDLGPGVEPEEATHIFELFGQGARESASRHGGLGIGLHLVQRLTELHGGHVGVNSLPGEGSTFWIRLPLPAADESDETEIAAAA
jgi:signal transduction histidine kinase